MKHSNLFSKLVKNIHGEHIFLNIKNFWQLQIMGTLKYVE